MDVFSGGNESSVRVVHLASFWKITCWSIFRSILLDSHCIFRASGWFWKDIWELETKGHAIWSPNQGFSSIKKVVTQCQWFPGDYCSSGHETFYGKIRVHPEKMGYLHSTVLARFWSVWTYTLSKGQAVCSVVVPQVHDTGTRGRRGLGFIVHQSLILYPIRYICFQINRNWEKMNEGSSNCFVHDSVRTGVSASMQSGEIKLLLVGWYRLTKCDTDWNYVKG